MVELEKISKMREMKRVIKSDEFIDGE